MTCAPSSVELVTYAQARRMHRNDGCERALQVLLKVVSVQLYSTVLLLNICISFRILENYSREGRRCNGASSRDPIDF